MFIGRGTGQHRAQSVQLALDHRAPLGDPAGDHVKTTRIHATHPIAADFFAVDERALFQHLDVLNYGGQREFEGLRDLADACRTYGQALKDSAANRLGEGPKAFIYRRLVKHVLEYARSNLTVKCGLK